MVRVDKYKIEATIPTKQQYGNIKPAIEFDIDSKDGINEAYDIAINHFQAVAKEFGSEELERAEIKK